MLRGAERKNGPPGRLHTQKVHMEQSKMRGTARGWRPESSRGRISADTDRGTNAKAENKREQQRTRVGDGGWVEWVEWVGSVGVLAGLPVPPKSWDYILLQSTVAQQKQRE